MSTLTKGLERREADLRPRRSEYRKLVLGLVYTVSSRRRRAPARLLRTAAAREGERQHLSAGVVKGRQKGGARSQQTHPSALGKWAVGTGGQGDGKADGKKN
jgi:hypothetical protein